MRLKALLAYFLICITLFASALAESTTPSEASVLGPVPGQNAIVISGDLKSGDSGDGVVSLQKQLAVLGYLCGEPTGTYDEATKTAVTEFESYLNDRNESRAMAAVLAGEAPAPPVTYAVDGEAEIAVLEELFAVEDGCVWQEVRLGDKNSEVLRLQNRLTTLGYLSGVRDGAFGGQTRTAVRAFQYAAGLPEDGIADLETQALLFDAAAPAAKYPSCAPGDKGERVVQVQKLLMRLGFMEGTIADGSYGPVTETAVRNAQTYLQKKGVLLGTHANAALETALGMGLPMEDEGTDTTGLSAEPNPDGEPLSAPGEAIAYNGEDPYDIVVNGVMDSLLMEYLSTQDTVSMIGTLKKDDWTEEVRRVQRRLYALEYVYTKADAIYGSKTEEAVKAFQKRNGLEETGKCDRETIALMFSDNCRKGLMKYLIKISVDKQKVYVYTYDANDEYTELVRTMTCSTGKKATPTPLGTFTNTGRGARWHYFKKFNTWAQYAWYIDGDIMFHSVLFNSDDEDTLIKSTVRNLGKRASHGCVRLAVDDAKWIWNNCEAHTKVIVY